MGKSSDYYNSNPAAKAVKDAYQKLQRGSTEVDPAQWSDED